MKIIDADAQIRRAVVDAPLSKCLNPEFDNGFGADLMVCPVCLEEYSHGKEGYTLSSDQYKAWAGRGSCTIFPFEGECGHAWNVCIGYHKGQNYLFIDIVRRATPIK